MSCKRLSLITLPSLGGTQCKIDSLTLEVGLYAGLKDTIHHILQPNVISVSLTPIGTTTAYIKQQISIAFQPY